MAASGGCGLIACSHLSCSPGATRNAVDFGRRDFLIDALAATAGFTGLGGCAAPLMSEAPSAQERAEVIVTNGRIATLNPRAPTAGAVAIRGGNIVAVGSAAEIERPRGPGTQVIDAGGGPLPPGLNRGDTPLIPGRLTYSDRKRVGRGAPLFRAL